ncbi:MAG: protein kinase [Bryobacteraceae bacterium]|jgi:serine/threonine-protein kinase
MTLRAGEKLGPYELIAPIGAGGMGEVYRARDIKLEREVAIKVLPEAVARDAERLARFEREAKVLASLNHPNIAQIYGFEESGNGCALIMELVPGQTLKGPLPLDTALNYAQQIAGALEAAHEKGIVHRDLKPANIMITPESMVKVLDFGLAAQMRDNASANPETSPTFTINATQAGVILGTAPYMAPEQARGKAVDKRADIWAFGCVLYEMLTGKQAFTGETTTDILAAVVKTEPDLTPVPVEVRRLIRRCLEKDSKKRLRDIGDAWELMEETQAPAPGPVTRSAWPWIIAVVLFLIAAAAAFGWWRGSQPVEQPQIRLDVDLGPNVSLTTPTGSSNVIIAPDGTRLVYLADVGGGQSSLFIRRLDQTKAIELPGTHHANSPFFSPDSQWVGFAIGERLYKVSVEGGAAVPQGETNGSSTGSSWGADGYITTAVLLKSLFRTPSSGGAAVPLAELAKGEFTFVAPQILPGGQAILYSAYTGARNDPDRARIEVLSLRDHSRKMVFQGGTSARYLATGKKSGYLVYANRSTLFAVPFDLDHPEKPGTPVSVLDDVGFNPGTYESQFDVSRTGTMVYRKAGGAADGMTTIQWVDAAGKKEPLVSKPGGYVYVRLSPDGRRLAAEVLEETGKDIQVYDFERETWTQLSAGGFFFKPAWSSDGQSVVFGALNGLYWARSDGASQPQPLSTKQSESVPEPWSMTPDGKRLVFSDGSVNSSQLWSAPLESVGGRLKAGTPEQILKSAFRDTEALLSPDGKWLAYESNSSGSDEIYVRAFPDNGGLWKISNNGGHNPIWSRNGHELLYQAGDQMMAVSYSAKGGTFAPEKPRVWLAKVGGTAWDLSPDGKRLLVLAPVGSPDAAKAEHEVVLFQNFFEYLRQKAPVSK